MKDISNLKIQKGAFSESQRGPGVLFTELIKKVLKLFNISMVDPCCPDPESLTLRYNSTEGKAQYYDPNSKSYVSLTAIEGAGLDAESIFIKPTSDHGYSLSLNTNLKTVFVDTSLALAQITIGVPDEFTEFTVNDNPREITFVGVGGNNATIQVFAGLTIDGRTQIPLREGESITIQSNGQEYRTKNHSFNRRDIKVVDSDYSASIYDDVIVFKDGISDITVELPDVPDFNGKKLTIKNLSSGFTLVLSGAGNDIDISSSVDIFFGESISVIKDSPNWIII